MAKIGSCAGVFAKMGNPWVSGREGLEQFGRSVDENPDQDLSDMMRRGDIRQAPKRNIFIDPARIIPEATERRRLVNLAARLNKELRAHTVTISAGKAKPRHLPITASRNAAKIAKSGYSLYVKTDDGGETEVERKAERIAFVSFKRAIARKDTVCVELWSYATGECVKRYRRRPRG